MIGKSTLIPVLVFLSPSAFAGGAPDPFFDSGFEGFEGCTVFDGAGDTVVIPVIEISGDLTLNGGKFPAVEYDDAQFILRDRLTGGTFEIGNSHDQSYSAKIIPGYYDLIYNVETPGATAPHNANALLMEDVALLETGILDIDVTAYTLSGDFLHNGGAFPAIEFDDANLFLDSVTAGRVMLGNTHDQSYANIPVLGGNYEIRYQVESPGVEVPWNEWGLVGQASVSANGNLDIDVQSVSLGGDFLHNGSPMPLSEFDDGNFYLETSGGDRVLLDNSHEGDYTRNVIEGEYDAYWEIETPGATVPINTRARITTGVDVTMGNFDINMASYSIAGDFTLNGGSFPNDPMITADVIFRDQVTDAENMVAQTHEQEYEQQLLEGTYDIVYRYQQGNGIPKNQAAVLDSIVVNNPAVQDVDVASRLFAFDILHNGVLFTNAAGEVANIWFRDPAGEDEALMGTTGEQHLSASVIPGTYDVHYGYVLGLTIPVNIDARVVQDLQVDPLPPVRGGGLQIDVSSMIVDGQFFLNDASPPNNALDDGRANIRFEQDTALLGFTSSGTFTRRVVRYPENSILYLHYSESIDPIIENPTVPLNTDTRFQCILQGDPPPF